MLKANGTFALVGSGEFLPGSEGLDRELLATLKEPARVIILPTASAPDGPGVAERWAKMAVAHFQSLGAEAQAVMLLSRQDADSIELRQQIAAANLVYLSGGKPGYLVKTLQGTLCWQAIQTVFEHGGVVAGCSAGAMALAGALAGFGLLRPLQPALGLVPNLVVIPHFDEIPGWLSGLVRFSSGKKLTIIGIEGSTALVGTRTQQSWRVVGKGAVTVFSPQGRKRFSNGETVKVGSASR